MRILRKYSGLTLMIFTSSLLQAEALHIGGFMSAGVTKTDSTNTVLTTNSIYDKVNYLANGILGVQIDYRHSSETKLSSQLISRDEPDGGFKVKAEWLYMSQKINSNLTFRAGRLRLPTYFASQHIFVGQAYDWVRPPLEVYSLNAGLTRYNGLNLLYEHEFPATTVSTEIYVGQAKDSIVYGGIPANLDTDKLYGFSVSSNAENLQLRASYLYTDAVFEGQVGNGILKAEIPAKFFVLGADYSINHFSVRSEVGRVVNEADLNKGTLEARYITFSYVIDQWTPLITIAGSDIDPKNRKNVRGNSIALGSRFDVNANFSIKGEWYRGKLIDGLLTLSTVPPDGYDDVIDVYSVTFNMMF